MPNKWDCSRTADFLSELEALCNRYGLNSNDVAEDLEEHTESCQHCQDKIKKFEEKYDALPV